MNHDLYIVTDKTTKIYHTKNGRCILKQIAFFINDLSHVGGTERVSTDVANMLSENYQIIFISMYQTNKTPFFPLSSNIKIINLYDKPIHGITRYPQLCLRLLKILKSHHIDIVVDVDGILDLYTLAIKRFAQVKVISWEHFNFHQNLGVPYRFFSRKWAGLSADAIVTLTHQDKSSYENGLAHLNCPVFAIHNPVILPTTKITYQHKSTMILSSGRFTHQKGFDLLVQAASQVLAGHPSWTWVICGDGEEKEKIRNLIASHHLQKRIILPGNSDMEQYYANASFFVLTSRYEGLGMVLLEAAAHKLPTVSFDCEAGPGEIILDSTNGYLIKANDVNELTRRILQLMDSEDLRVSFSSHAHDNFTEFLPEYIEKQWIHLLNSLD